MKSWGGKIDAVNVEDWLEVDADNSGDECQNEDEIAANVSSGILDSCG